LSTIFLSVRPRGLTMRRALRLSLSGASLTFVPRFQHPAIFTIPQGSQFSRPPCILRPFSSFKACRKEDSSANVKALNQNGLDQHEESLKSQVDSKLGQAEERQLRTPWHREGSDKPPVRRLRSASAMTKGSSLQVRGITRRLANIHDQESY
jgi:hypothetical protein